ncbi:MAG TPA: hypothetical protein VFA69_04745 [Candidatus Nitrosotalea sp.]|nr:hypothetical protein [Candidatus Nitrosotalea sp.]
MPTTSKQDSFNHKKTTSISFRLPEELIEEIQTEAQLNNVSANVLVHRILERYTKWDANAAKGGYIPVTKGLIFELFDKISDKEIIEIAKRVEMKEFEDIALLLRNKFDIESTLDLIETRAKVSGFPYRYSVKGAIHSFVIQHDINEKWSLYLASRYKQVFEDLGLKSVKFHTTANTIQFDLHVNLPGV